MKVLFWNSSINIQKIKEEYQMNKPVTDPYYSKANRRENKIRRHAVKNKFYAYAHYKKYAAPESGNGDWRAIAKEFNL